MHNPTRLRAILVRYSFYGLVSFCILLLSACAQNSRQPDWVDKPFSDYPADQYLSAVGEARTREAAAARARANLSRVFQVAIKDSSQDFSEAIVTTNNNGQQVNNQQRAARFVNSEAAQVLEGTEIIEYWQSPEGDIFSLAVLEKSSASRRFRGAIRAADVKVAALLSYASDKAPNPVVALRALEKARLMQLERDNSNRNLAVTAGKGMISSHSSERIENVIRQALASLSFAVKADDNLMQGELESAVAGLGIQQRDQSEYVLSSKIDTQPLQKKQGWWWLRGSLELSLNYEDETIARQRWPVKQSALDKGMVQQRLRDAVNKKLSSNLYQMLTSEVEK
jgi:hypothetical protein